MTLIRTKLIDCFHLVFPELTHAEIVNATQENLTAWDSLAAIQLIHVIEDIFKVTLDLERLSELRSFVAIENYLSGDTVVPMKGIILDCDGVLWDEILAEHDDIKPNWEFLKWLEQQADNGVLLALATKNDSYLVQSMLSNSTLFDTWAHKIYPVEAGWGPKSESVERILKTWNVLPESVTFVDDNEFEIEEVKQRFPTINAVWFKTIATKAAIRRLSPLYAKSVVTEDDRQRMKTIRQGAEFNRGLAKAANPDDYLRTLDQHAVLDFNYSDRVLELVNKVNQFNLNGIRRTKEELTAPGTFLMSVQYSDKFGDMGTVGVLHGELKGATFHLDTFVLSCRAFSRNVERLMLDRLFVLLPQTKRIWYHAQYTGKNNVAFQFFNNLCAENSDSPLILRSDAPNPLEGDSELFHACGFKTGYLWNYKNSPEVLFQ